MVENKLNDNLQKLLRYVADPISFLTIVPTGVKQTQRLYGLALMPFIGLAIGLLVGSIFYALLPHIGSLGAASVAVAVYVLITGAMHLDALADLADGIACIGTQENKLAAMKDPALGSAGVVSIVLTVVLYIALFQQLNLRSSLADFGLVFVLPRVNIIWLLLNFYTSAGIGQSWLNSDSPLQLVPGAAILTILGLFLQYRVVFSIAASLAICAIVVVLSKRLFGQVGGDAIGATIELGQIVTLAIAIAR